MRMLRWLTSSMAGLMLVSCVTINIYFPAAAAEKAADRIIEDVWGSEKTPKDLSTLDQQSQLKRNISINIAILIMNWLASPVEAAEANLNINSSAINNIRATMKNRHNSLKLYYDSGAIGLTENGLITVRDVRTISLKDRNTVKSLVADENKDREALYAEIARANGHSEWKADIQSTFAHRWVSNAASGWWYQSAGNWLQK